MRYLITGGFGYVGSWLSRHLAAQGHEIFIISRQSHQLDLGFPYTLIQADLSTISELELSEKIPFGLDACIHAASFNESFSPDYPKQALLHTSYGTRNILAALVNASESRKLAFPLFIYCSTFHIYGKSSGHITTKDPSKPLNDYAISHSFAEQYCQLFSEKYALPSIIVRMTNTYGAPISQTFNKWYLLLNDLCKQAVHQSEITINTNPLTQRDFIWLGDVVQSFELLLQRPDLAGKSFLLASQAPLSLRELAETVQKTSEEFLGKKISIRYASRQETVPPLSIDASDFYAEFPHFRSHNKLAEECKNILSYILQAGIK